MGKKSYLPDVATGFWPAFYEPLRHWGSKLADWVAPASEASADDNLYKIALELPGVAEADITVTADDGTVTVTGEKKTTHEEKGETYFFSERQYGSFSRSFRLPRDADGAKLAADLKDGVLTISVPKLRLGTAESPRKIAVRKAA